MHKHYGKRVFFFKARWFNRGKNLFAVVCRTYLAGCFLVFVVNILQICSESIQVFNLLAPEFHI